MFSRTQGGEAIPVVTTTVVVIGTVVVVVGVVVVVAVVVVVSAVELVSENQGNQRKKKKMIIRVKTTHNYNHNTPKEMYQLKVQHQVRISATNRAVS